MYTAGAGATCAARRSVREARKLAAMESRQARDIHRIVGEVPGNSDEYAVERESAKFGITEASPDNKKEFGTMSSAQEHKLADVSFNTASRNINNVSMAAVGVGAMAAGSGSEQQDGQHVAGNIQESLAHQAARLLEGSAHEEHRPLLLTSLLARISQGVNTKSGQVLSVAKSGLRAGSDDTPDTHINTVTSGVTSPLRRAADPSGAETLADKIGRIDVSSGYADFTDRTWIIRPSGLVRSITFNMTFLAIEKGFDFVIVSSCPDGKCSEIYRYSDRKVVMCCSWFDYLPRKTDETYKKIEYFSDEVDCNRISINTNEIRVRFVTDGPTPRDIDPSNKNLVYQGFSAAYEAYETLIQESIGCPAFNKTLTDTQGSVASIADWIIPWQASGEYDYWENTYTGMNNYMFQGNPPPRNPTADVLYKEFMTYNGRDCVPRYEYIHEYGWTDDQTFQQDCGDVFGRGQTKWWRIKPEIPADEVTEATKIELIFHGLVLEDGLDELTLYTCKGGKCEELRSISGAYPFRGTEGRLGYAYEPNPESSPEPSPHTPVETTPATEPETTAADAPVETTPAPDSETTADVAVETTPEPAGRRWMLDLEERASGSGRRQSQANRCNRMILEADEVRLKLKTSVMPTNSSGFWVSYRTHTRSSPIPVDDATCADDVNRTITAAEGCISFDPRGPPHGGLAGQEPSAGDVWGIPPNGKGVWVIKPEGAQTITLYPPDLKFEKNFDKMRIFACKGNKCTQLYKDMTGNTRSTNSFCDIYQKTGEIRIEVTFDGTNNMDSTFTGLCYTSAQTVEDEEQKETSGFECGYERLSTPSGTFSEVITLPTEGQKLKPKTWIIDPGNGTTSINMTFSRFALAWYQAMILSWDCNEDGECAHEKTISYARPSDVDFENYLHKTCLTVTSSSVVRNAGMYCFVLLSTCCFQYLSYTS
jgi:hypothetical protein